jgi:hypothetical protein
MCPKKTAPLSYHRVGNLNNHRGAEKTDAKLRKKLLTTNKTLPSEGTDGKLF